MDITYHKIYSKQLGQDFEFKAYGHAGKPVLVFPTSCGRFFDYENQGMIATLAPYIDAGDIRVFCVDGRDWESWYKPVKDEWIGIRHHQWEKCIVLEVIPFLAQTYGLDEKFLATGASFGAFHSANFFLKYPGVVDSAICQSGIYDVRAEFNYYDEGIYLNSPALYLPNMNDEKFLDRVRDGYIIVSHGRGAWETFNHQAWELSQSLGAKNIPHWYDVWSEQWPHDWPTWHAQLKVYLPILRDGVLYKNGVRRITGPKRHMAKLEVPALD